MVTYIVLVISTAIPVWATTVNNYFSSHVRIQKDHGHKVVDTGPYAYVRHPGYTFMIISAPATALVLSSLWTLIPALFPIPIFIIRTALEDKTLQNELTGYKDYAKRVRHKPIPNIW